jgi:hypothetical protein
MSKPQKDLAGVRNPLDQLARTYTRSLSQIGRRRRQSLRFYRDQPNLSFFSRQSLRKSLPDSTFKEIEVSSTGALHCDRRKRIEL